MDQLDMFAANVRPGDPETSHAAAALKRVTLRQRVELVLSRHPHGLTDYELTDLLGLDRHRKPSVGKRRQELLAVDTGLRRPSPDGQPCVVWALQIWPTETERQGSTPDRVTPSGVTSVGQHIHRRPAKGVPTSKQVAPGGGTIHQLRKRDPR